MVDMVVNIRNNDASLFSAQVEMMTNNDDDLCDSIDDYNYHKHIIDFFITKCNGIVLDFGPDRIMSRMEHTYEGGWARFTVIATADCIPNLTATTITLYLNGQAISETVVSNYVIYPDPDPNFHIGSYKGLLHFAEGYIS